MIDIYLLNEDGTTRPAPSIEEGMAAMETSNKRVALHEFFDGAQLSTVFLFIDHGWDGTPMLFESLWFDGLQDGNKVRYRTLAEAKVGHQAMVEEYARLARHVYGVSYRRAKKMVAVSRHSHRLNAAWLRKNRKEPLYGERQQLHPRW